LVAALSQMIVEAGGGGRTQAQRRSPLEAVPAERTSSGGVFPPMDGRIRASEHGWAVSEAEAVGARST
jgi:hypothetical protein